METDDLEFKMTFRRSRSHLRTSQITHLSLERSTHVYHQCHQTLKPPGTFQTLLTLTLVLALTLQGAQGQFSCQQPGYNEIVPWRTEAGSSNVTWRLDQVCSSTVQCYGTTSQGGNQPLDAQLCPVQLQVGDGLFLLPPPAGSPYTTTVANVTEAAFYTCPSRAYPEDQILRNSDPSRALQIPPRFLLPGVVYLAQHPDGAFSNCNFGLRLQVLIKDQVCMPPATGGTPGTQEELCSGRGVCGSRFLEDRYRCYCFQNYRGSHCTEFDACAAVPCKNGGKCIDGDEGLLGSTFLCICAEGFTGPDCTEILGQCAPAVCGNGSCVAVSQAAFRCQCRTGFSGTFCDQFTDMCTPNPCLNLGTCLTRLLTHTCQCITGFTGANCETNIDECASSPCAQGATCVDDVNGFYCRCPPGFDSDFCFEPTNYCSSSPCENNAECVPVLNGYFCNCTLGFQGDRCETIISRCSEVPGVCQHGGHCLQSPGGPVQCQCSPGWTGSTCDKLDNLCRFDPCPNHTVCIDRSTMQQPGAYACVCPPGFTGDKCQSEIVECTSNPCLNGGVCVDKLDGYSCLCTEAYSGQNCEKNIDMCKDRAALLCQNNATCIDGDDNYDYTCVCRPGFTSADCSANINECESSPCQYSGTCQDRVNGYTCLCADGFSGSNCQVYFNYCNLRPCRNGAQCTPQLGGYTCECTSGWSGTNCTQDVDECQSSPCLNGATCQNLENQYRCICGGDYYGRQCETSFDNCGPFSCLNGATCEDLVDDYRCLCQPGYVGRDCGTELVECLSAPCRNGGICQDLVNGYRCFCDTNLWGGVNCEIPLNNCSSGPCFNGGTCRPQAPPSDFTCECKPRYTGRLCQISVSLCNSSPCLNSGTCLENVQALNYTCTCAVGYTGPRCESDVDYCLGHNCRNGATCRDGVTGYTCDCPSGFTGQICETNIDGCASNPCKNSAICVDADTDTGYECFCVNGFTGDDCSKEVNECDSSPCINGGLCLDRVNRFICVCPLGYEGISCQTNKDDCVNHNCRNNAVCVDGVNSYSCQCIPGYVGSDCSFEIDECLSSPCDPTGSLLCTDQVANYSCVCKAGYTGRNCEQEVDECQSNPCRNGATCRNLLNRYQCFCIPGTTGNHCETVIDNCASNPCGIGTCQGSVSDYRCLCPNDGRNYDANCQPILPCSSNPCRNQATCVNDGNGYRCLCRYGFTGADCRIADYCKVFNVSCLNGGLCVSVDKNFTCVCNAGYIGRFCETDNDECANHICQNGATCEDRVNSYGCNCRPGFVGRFCEDVATSCVEAPCYNGATCISTPNFAAQTLFTCICAPGYEGSYCERESDACGSNPCKNGGTCSQRRGSFECACKAGYAGTTCEQDVDECIGHGCRNGATCIDRVNGYTCRCPVGFTGTLCQSEVNECTSSPCQNGGRCIDGVDGYQCFCKNGFTGGHCEVDYNECLSNPCQNQATCVDSAASFRCQCPLGVTGTLCQTNIDECSSSPCRHGATCIDLYNGYNCNCTEGYSGVHCETDVDECASSPCDNGGTCRDRVGRYICDCVQPFRGVNCNLLPCDLNPCESGGTCYNDLSRLPDGFRCQCIEGLTGTRCQSNINDCVARTDGTVPCSGRGLCLDDVNKYTCLCNPGWKGKDCEVPIDECTNNECRNGATCVNLWTGYRCHCAVGFEGQFCERETDECQPQPCKNSATCVDRHNDYSCLCREGWTGKDCDTEVNECILTGASPCRNGGTCIDGFAAFTCQCAPFYTGTLCESRYDPCASENYPCKQEALCSTNQDGSYTCDCPRGYTGTNCEIDVNECASSPCTNGGRCEDRSASYRCFCPLGFTGNQCELNIDDCLYCKNGATCQDLTNGYICTCTAGFTGQNCTDDVDECDVPSSPCRNGATCTNTVGGYNCICKPGYTGVQCETDVDECVSAPCKNGALCSQGFGDFNCFCRIGYTGKLCDIEIDECASEPCGNGICTDLVNNYTCECLPGWSGPNCLQQVDECASSPCSNSGICIDQVNAFRCVCPAGYTGPHCEIDIEVCQRDGLSQCLNGGTCNEGPGNAFDCICKPGYAGQFCEVDINECYSFPCKNGATCEDRIDGYFCTCTPGYTGDDCSADVDECSSSPCMNQGICQETPRGGYECLCRSGLGGVHCEINYNDCLPTMCLNGGTCVDGLNTHTCICPSHTTGRSCETLLLTPTPTLQPSITTSPPLTSLSTVSTPVIQPTTGVVQSSTIHIASSSMLSGTVGFSVVEEDSVTFVSRVSETIILRPSETRISVAMETETPVIASMTTIATPKQMETNFVDSSLYLATVSEIMVSDTEIVSPLETTISVDMETESPMIYGSSYDLASQSESTPLFSSSPILTSETADYISETSLAETEMFFSTSLFSTQLPVLPTLSLSPSHSPDIETEIDSSSNYVATSASQTVTGVTASPTISDTPGFVSSSLYTSTNSESPLIGTPSATESVSHSIDTSTSTAELYVTSEVQTVGITPSVTMDSVVDSSSFTPQIESLFSPIISETVIPVEVSHVSDTDISAISPTASNMIDNTASISVISQHIDPTDLVSTVPGQISTDMSETLRPSMSTSAIQMPPISSSSHIEFMSSSFDINDLSEITFTESLSVKESVAITFVLTDVMSVSQTVSFSESSTDVNTISSSNDFSNTIPTVETSHSIFPSIVPTTTSIRGTTIRDETSDSLSLQTQTVEPTISDSTMLLGSTLTEDLTLTRSEVMMTRFSTSLAPTESTMETEVLSNIPEVSTGLVQPVTQNSMYVSTLSLHQSMTTPLDVLTQTIRISDSDFASTTAMDIVPTTSVSNLQTQTLDTIFASVSMISGSDSPSESVNSGILTASPPRVMPDSTTEQLSVMTTFVQSTGLSSSFSSSTTPMSAIAGSSSDYVSQGSTAPLETSLFESLAGTTIITSSATETLTVGSTSVGILMNQTAGTPSETLFMSTSLSDEILTTVLPKPDIGVTDSVDSTNEVSRPVTTRLPEITATDFIDSIDSLVLSDSSTGIAETSVLVPPFTDSVSNMLVTTLDLATSLDLATESVMLSVTQIDSFSMSTPVTDQLTGMLLSSTIDTEILTSVPIEMTSVITKSIASVIPSMSPTAIPETQSTLTLSSGTESLGQSSEFASNSPDPSSTSPIVLETTFSVSSAFSVTATIEGSPSSSPSGEIETQVSTSESASPFTSSPQPSGTSLSQQASTTTLLSPVSSSGSLEMEPSVTLSSSTESPGFMTDSIQTMTAPLQPSSTSEDLFATILLTSPGSLFPSISDITQSTGTIVPSKTMVSRSDTSIDSTIGDTELVSPLSPSMSTEPMASESSTLFTMLLPSVSDTLSSGNTVSPSMSTEPMASESSTLFTILVPSVSDTLSSGNTVSPSMSTEPMASESSTLFTMLMPSVSDTLSSGNTVSPSMSTEPMASESSTLFTMLLPSVSDTLSSGNTVSPSMSTEPMASESSTLFTMLLPSISDTLSSGSTVPPTISTDPITSESSTLFTMLVPSLSETLSVPLGQTSLQTDLPSQSPIIQDSMRTTIGESLLPSFSTLPDSSMSVLVEPASMTQTIQDSLLSSTPIDSEETGVVDATLVTKSISDNTVLTSSDSDSAGTLLTISIPVITTGASMMAPSSSSSFGQTSSAGESVLPESVSTVSNSLLPTITPTISNPPADTSITVPAPSTTDGGLPVDETMTQTAIESGQPSQTTIPTTLVTVLPTKVSTSSPSLAPTAISPTPTMTVGPTSTVAMTTAKPTPEPTSCGDVLVPCYNNASCVDVTLANGTDTFVCICPEKYTGKRCDSPIVFDPLKFTGYSLLTFDPIPLRSQNTIKLTLRTYQSNGVIFYSAKDYSVLDSTHYIRLIIKDGYLVYQFSCVFEKFNLESKVRVDSGELFNIIIRQSEDCKAELEVDWSGNNVKVEIGAPFVFSSLYLKTLSTFYVGGIPDNVTYVPSAAPNFAGCIGVININGAHYGYFEARWAVNIAECGITVPTLPPPGTTINPSPLPSCDDVTCQNGGTCRDVLSSSERSGYQCDCPLHFVGVHCEQEIGISFPEFSGQSYLKHADLDLSGRPSNDLYLTFRTASLNGTLLYAANTEGEFVHLFVNGGYLRYQASCGPSSVLFVDTRMLVNYNNLTAVNVRQTVEEDGDCTVTVTVNDNVQTTVTLSLAPAQRGQMFDLGPLYLGGLSPQVTPYPRANPFINFIGCIRHLQINGEERLVFQDAVDGRNIAECDVPPCRYTPCYNNATCLPSVDGYTCECLPSYSGALCERTACDRNPCQHGGTCLHQQDTTTYTCLCPYGRHGINCERVLTITRPEYYGTQLGYISFAAFPRPLGLDYTFDVQFTFTLTDRAHTGLMLFAGQEAANPKYGADFFAVGIQDGYVHFQFNLGSGIAHLRSQLPVNSSRPTHQVLLGRNRQTGYLKVDGQPNVTGSSGGGLQGLNIFSHLYVGGYDNYNLALPSDVVFRDGFKGCLFDIQLRTGTNGHWKSPGNVMTGRNVGQCHLSECDVTECRNGATCVNLGATYRCDCTDGWKGPTCSDVITPCDGNHQCTEGATCLPLVSGGYTCHCPLGKAGTLCEQNIVISDARFVGETSYMGFTHKGSLRFAIDIRLQFKPEVTTGLLFYIAEHLSMRSGDFLSVVLQDGAVQLRYRVGTAPTVIVTSQNKVSTSSGVWYVVEAGRNTTHGYVTLDGRTTSVKVTGQMVGLDVTTLIYVGGVPDLGTLAPSALQDEPSAFEGCVRELVVNKHSYQLTEKGASTGVNVVDCDGTSCGYQVCQNGGTCYPQSNSGFVCGCTPDYYGYICETSVLCRNNPCVGGATCIPEVANATYRCICPLGRRGARCDEEFTFTTARFTGDSYILYQDPNYNDSDVTKTYMSFNFSTTAYNGLIVWNGEAYSDKDDYLGVGIHNGRARVVISLGWWTREDVITDEIVNDGAWHSIIIQRSDRRVRVYLDGKVYDVTLAGQFGGLNTGGGHYFGGFEFDKSTHDETCSHFDSSFTGCLRDVHLRVDGEPLNLLTKASSGANVLSCDGR